jgi:hypothetical protein
MTPPVKPHHAGLILTDNSQSGLEAALIEVV